MQKVCFFNVVILMALCSGQESCIKGAHPDLSTPQGFGPGNMTSAYFNNKFNRLVQLTKEGTNNPQGPRAYGGAFGSPFKARFTQMFTNAQQTGLVAQYKQLLLGQNQDFKKSDYFRLYLFSPQLLIEIARQQNIYGKGQPFEYDASKESEAGLSPMPVIGSYNSTRGELTITSYGFLRGLIDAIDQTPKSTELFELLKNLNTALDKAIDMQEQASMSRNFEDTISKLRDLYRQGKDQIAQDLANVLRKYQ
jgi:hypothetical protein